MMPSTRKESVVDVTLPLYIIYRVIEGVKYVLHLANTGDGVPATAKPVTQMYAGEDYLGLRKFRLHTRSDVLVVPDDVDRNASIWWYDLSGHRYLHDLHDVKYICSSSLNDTNIEHRA